MAHGGRRPNAGRKVSSLTVRSRETAEQLVAKGETPLDIMVANMLHFHRLAETAEAALAEISAETVLSMAPDEQFKHLLAQVKKAAGLRESAQSCARDAAPYVHPRLATVEHSGKDGDAIAVRFVIESAPDAS